MITFLLVSYGYISSATFSHLYQPHMYEVYRLKSFITPVEYLLVSMGRVHDGVNSLEVYPHRARQPIYGISWNNHTKTYRFPYRNR